MFNKPTSFLILLLLFSAAAFAEICPLSLQVKSDNKTVKCINELPYSNLKPNGWDRSLADIIKGSVCYMAAVSSNPECMSVGVLTRAKGYCSTVPQVMVEDVIKQCEAKGCKCEIAINNGTLVNKDVLADWETYYSKLATTNSSQQIAENMTPKKEPTKKNIGINNQDFFIQIETSASDINGVISIFIKASSPTQSLEINGDEQGKQREGKYTVKRVLKADHENIFEITATDERGNKDKKVITLIRNAYKSADQILSLTPERITPAKSRDAVAIIIGIQNYKRVPKADFANADAISFYEYATRALGVKPENIKLLVDSDADEIAIIKTFKNWLPSQIKKDKTDLYVFYSGHGLPSTDGKSLQFLPHTVDVDLLERTSISQKEIISAIQTAQPKSVAMFIDSCYSGVSRAGDSLLASARPITLKSIEGAYPSNFLVFSASSSAQISSSSPELKHGIFSFYLMKGMEGDADENKDGKISALELQDYLSKNVTLHAMSLNREQSPQLKGDENRILFSR